MFDRLVDWTAAIARNLGSEFAGALLRPHAPILEALEEQGTPPDEVYEAARAAGRQIARELTDYESYLRASPPAPPLHLWRGG
jgi:hypothetical protein